jgi:hypothetical protein
VSNGYARPAKNGTLLNLRVAPGAKRTSLEGPYGEHTLKLKVSAPPVNGKANAEVERFLADLLSLPRSSVSVTRGVASKDKTVLLHDADPHQIQKTLSIHLS